MTGCSKDAAAELIQNLNSRWKREWKTDEAKR